MKALAQLTERERTEMLRVGPVPLRAPWSHDLMVLPCREDRTSCVGEQLLRAAAAAAHQCFMCYLDCKFSYDMSPPNAPPAVSTELRS